MIEILKFNQMNKEEQQKYINQMSSWYRYMDSEQAEKDLPPYPQYRDEIIIKLIELGGNIKYE